MVGEETAGSLWDPLFGYAWDGGFWSAESMSQATKRKFKGLYRVVFDGSGTIGTHHAVIYAGAVSSQIQWAAFDEAWNDILVRNDLAYLKMAEATTFYGEFLPKVTEWEADKEAKRDALLAQFGNLRQRYALGITGCGYITRTTGGPSPFAPTSSIAEQKKKQFQKTILGLLRMIPADYAVQLACDVEKDVEEHYRGWIEGVIRSDSDKVARIVGISFFDDKFVPAIQFADMAAWVIRQELERLMLRPEQPMNPLFLLLLGHSTATVEPIGSNRMAMEFQV